MRKLELKKMRDLLKPYLEACETYLEYAENNTRTQQLIENKVMVFDEGVWKTWHNKQAELMLLLDRLAFSYNHSYSSVNTLTFGGARVNRNSLPAIPKIAASELDKENIYQAFCAVREALSQTTSRRKNYGLHVTPFHINGFMILALEIHSALYKILGEH
jgi:hypothetical protein